MGLIARYTHWLHGRWPAGTVENLPQVDENGVSNIAGLYIVGDLTGIPLLKFSADTGARAVHHIAADPSFQQARDKSAPDLIDIAIIGAGVSGMSAALEARAAGLSFVVIEAAEPFATLVNFPKEKPIYTYPTDMEPAGQIRFKSAVKEPLLAELKAQTVDAGIETLNAHVERVEKSGDTFVVVIPKGDSIRARRVVVGIGRSGNFRKLGVPGEAMDKVYNRLHDPVDFCDKDVLVVGGGDSALETAIAIAQCGGRVTLSYRKAEFARPKPDNIEKLEQLAAEADVGVDTPSSERRTTRNGHFVEGGRKAGSIRQMMASQVQRIDEHSVLVKDAEGQEHALDNDAVFSMIGREAPLDFFRRSGVAISGEMNARQWTGLGLFMALCFFLYNWKAGGDLTNIFKGSHWFPFNVPDFMQSLATQAGDLSTLLGVLTFNLGKPGFWYSLLYSGLVIGFGMRRVRRRQTPYVKWQTLSLIAFQVVPLFLLPYIALPYLGHNGLFDSGWLKGAADALFPVVNYDHGREYWRAFGLVLAWPLFVWNAFSGEPMGWWLAISFVQTFVFIPLIVYFWGKGAYCGWICSCGALAETLGDEHRHKMPHGANWNKANMVGQVILLLCFVMLLGRVISWVTPQSSSGEFFRQLYEGMLYGWQVAGIQLNYRWSIDLMLAGVVGYGAYFWYSGRVWCRFACPLAALMHIYARFSRFRILSEKKKCISCNVCTSVCHQGIDIMNFANKGLPMADPECVRCSACVQSCPTGVLTFGQVDPKSGTVLKVDALAASPVRMRENG
jgi:NosR/NirI family transcriptional regulator, nitrous oxide reductase regulator